MPLLPVAAMGAPMPTQNPAGPPPPRVGLGPPLQRREDEYLDDDGED